MKAQLVTKVFVKCPGCGESEECVSHLFNTNWSTFGTWHCHQCGVQYEGKINSPVDIDLKIMERPANEVLLTLLVLEPRDKPIYLVLRDAAYYGEADRKEYYYNEHTCPTNCLQMVETIVDGTDYDPHGIFRHVGSSFVARDFDFDDDAKVKIIVDGLIRDRPSGEDE